MLTDDMKDLVAGTMLCFAATINEDGSPICRQKFSAVHDDTHLVREHGAARHG